MIPQSLLKAMSVTLAVFSTFFLTIPAKAQTTFLDTTFGGDGIVTSDFGGNIDQAYAVAIQQDGKIVAAGYSNTGLALTKDIALVRFNADGTIDNTFGTGGRVTTDFGYNNDDYAYAINIQIDNKILIAGSSFDGVGYRFALVRYNPDGSLDNTFGTGGLFASNFGGLDDWARSLIVLNDGKILAGGFCNLDWHHNFAVLKCNPNGTLDNTFGTGGQVHTLFDFNRHDQSYAMAMQADGKIILAGYSYVGTSSNYQLSMARYNADGTLDNTFDGDGMVITDLGVMIGEAYAVQIQGDNKIVVAGYNFVGADMNYMVARYNTDGSIDNTFGTGGFISTDFGGGDEDNATSLILLEDGKMLVAGHTRGSYGLDFSLARYNNDGTLDATFGYGGKITTQITHDSDGANAMSLQPDGKIVLAGYSYTGIGSDFAVIRYDPSIIGEVNTDEPDASNLQVSPNPFSSQLNIQTATAGNIFLFDMLGRMVLSQPVTAGSSMLNTENVSPGSYLIRYADGQSSSEKIVIKN